MKYFFRRIFFRFCVSKLNFFYTKKISPNYNYQSLENYLKNKKIALVGNSKNILYEKKNIDEFDIVIRINIPPIKKYYNKIGKRCDIIMLSNGPVKLLIPNVYNVWFSPNYNFVPFHKKLFYNYQLVHYRFDWFEELRGILGSNPSTGAQSLHFLIKLLKKPNITLFGFDHNRGNAWYADLPVQKDSHDWNAEKKYFESLINDNIRYFQNKKKKKYY